MIGEKKYTANTAYHQCIKTIFITLFLLLTILTGCGPGKEDKENNADLAGKTFPSNSVDPLGDVFKILNLGQEDLIRPLYLEEGYHLICRNPLIDHLARSPFILKEWADNTSDGLQQRAGRSIADTLQFTYSTLSNGRGAEHLVSGYSEFTGGFEAAYIEALRANNEAPSNVSINLINQIGFTKAFDKKIGNLLYQILQGSILIEEAVSNLSKEDILFITSKPEFFFFPDGRSFNFLTAHVHVQKKIVAISRKINFNKINKAGMLVAKAIDDLYYYCEANQSEYLSSPFYADYISLPSPVGEIVILGTGDSEFEGNGALVVDLGGNDIYSGRIASGDNMPGRISVAIDIGGDDAYGKRDISRSNGFGCLGIGILIDVEGNDRYVSGDMGQGSGMFGIGLLQDNEGNDTYEMGMMGQGFGVFGTGLILDNKGNDKYIIRGMGQGCGSTMGIGVLCDTRGNDIYMANRDANKTKLIADEWCHVQGSGLSIRSPAWTRNPSLYGGVGFLSDGQGNDTYNASHGNAMGSSYFMSVGALVDHNGDDKYLPQNGYSMAYAVHLSNAVLIDRNGDDYYSATTESGGVGSDRSTAILIDYDGNDIYGPTSKQNMADISYGSSKKPKAIGFLIDYKGNDQYFAKHSGYGESCGGVIPPVEPEDWSNGVLLDLDGEDYYFKKGRKDNHYYSYYNHGLCYDTEYKGENFLSGINSGLQQPAIKKDGLLKTIEKSSIRNEVSRLIETDPYTKFSVIDKLIERGTEILPELVDILLESEANDLNRDILEVLTIFIIDHRIKKKHTKEFAKLLKSKDPFVRKYTAGMFGWWNVKSAEYFLITALDDKDEGVREFVILALGAVGSENAVNSLIKVFKKDLSTKCKRVSVQALATTLDREGKDNLNLPSTLKKEVQEQFFDALLCPDAITRKNAARGIGYFRNNSESLLALRHALKDKDVYVRRAAAQFLILAGKKEGIPVLIETLKFPSIDTFEHYDHELAKDLAYYCGVDFNKDERYEYVTWKKWWDDNGRDVDLKKNIDIMLKIEKAFTLKNEEQGIEIFDQLIRENPDNIVIKNRYKRFCFEWITFHLPVSREKKESAVNRKKRLKKIKTQLETGNYEPGINKKG